MARQGEREVTPAEEKVAREIVICAALDVTTYPDLVDRIASALRARHEEGRRAGIEEAASAIRKRADVLSDVDADGNARDVGSLVGAAMLVEKLLPATPASAEHGKSFGAAGTAPDPDRPLGQQGVADLVASPSASHAPAEPSPAHPVEAQATFSEFTFHEDGSVTEKPHEPVRVEFVEKPCDVPGCDGVIRILAKHGEGHTLVETRECRPGEPSEFGAPSPLWSIAPKPGAESAPYRPGVADVEAVMEPLPSAGGERCGTCGGNGSVWDGARDGSLLVCPDCSSGARR